MGRKRIEPGPNVEREIEVRTARGESAKTIYEVLGRRLSVSTIARRQDELRGKAPKPPTTTPEPEPKHEDVPEDLPETAPTEKIDKWIARLETAATTAEAQGNLATLASLSAKAAALYALRHRTAPLPKADPNDNPDFKALAAAGRERLKKLAHGLFAERG